MVTPPVQLTTRPGPSSAGASSLGQSSAGQSSAASPKTAVPGTAVPGTAVSGAAVPETADSETAVSETAAYEPGQPTAESASVTGEEPAREGARLASTAAPARSGITLTSLTRSYRGQHGQEANPYTKIIA